jgi:hypothetical protein
MPIAPLSVESPAHGFRAANCVITFIACVRPRKIEAIR